jgi:hypothetical protein
LAHSPIISVITVIGKDIAHFPDQELPVTFFDGVIEIRDGYPLIYRTHRQIFQYRFSAIRHVPRPFRIRFQFADPVRFINIAA